MKKLLVILLLLLPACGISKQEVKHDAWKKNRNIDNINLEHTYKLDNGTIIYIGSSGHGTWIWEKDKVTGKLNYISGMWFFYGIAKSCPDENLENVLFAIQKEYYYMGGYNEDPPIRMYDLYNPKPWMDNELGMVPNMKWARGWCTFYKPINEDGKT